jgi:hypothetical protein
MVLRVSTSGTDAVRQRISALLRGATILRDVAARSRNAGLRTELRKRIEDTAKSIPEKMMEAYGQLGTSLEREQAYILYVGCHDSIWDIAATIADQ